MRERERGVVAEREIVNQPCHSLLFGKFASFKNAVLETLILAILMILRMLKAPRLNPREYISRTSKISPREGR